MLLTTCLVTIWAPALKSSSELIDWFCTCVNKVYHWVNQGTVAKSFLLKYLFHMGNGLYMYIYVSRNTHMCFCKSDFLRSVGRVFPHRVALFCTHLEPAQCITIQATHCLLDPGDTTLTRCMHFQSNQKRQMRISRQFKPTFMQSASFRSDWGNLATRTRRAWLGAEL